MVSIKKLLRLDRGNVVDEGNAAPVCENMDFVSSEQYKLIRANLDFTIEDTSKCPVIGVTSSMRGEGKSTTAVNLAYSYAQKGCKVLLIDGDMRIPSVAKKLGISGTPGLSDLLKGGTTGVSGIQTTKTPNWYVLPSGMCPPNPSELLGSNRMKNLLNKLREVFDYIILDLPPINIVADAIEVSGFISGLILVVREEYTQKKELEVCVRQLHLSNVKVLGVVMNGIHSGGKIYDKYKSKKYKDYKKDYTSDEKTGTGSAPRI
ncbi:MAG: CpsD/CapB family tyrosine-protein kinase [Clostridia bacterium]|nr:CpsD/CapB family tyrosine-protein kinase [Clostridia bacterium]